MSVKRKAERGEEADPVVLEDVVQALYRLKDGIKETACIASPKLGRLAGCDLFLKFEHKQHTGSFKERGALNSLLQLSDDQRKRGVIAASAGNHALGLAYHGQRLGVPVTVVMPTNAPLTKVTNCEALGAQVLLHGHDFAEAKEEAERMAAKDGFEYVNGYDKPSVIAGAGTIAMELVAQLKEFDAIVVPCGGGGLIAGIAVALKSIAPKTEIIGVEPRNCASMAEALAKGKPVQAANQPTLADGLAVPVVGSNAFALCRKHVDDFVSVSENWISLAVLRLLELEKQIVEGAGAAGLAALLSGQLDRLRGKRVATILCGGNIDVSMLGQVVSRGMASDGRLVRFQAQIIDRPGGLLGLVQLIAAKGGSVKQVTHERAFVTSDASLLNIYCTCVVETRNKEHSMQLVNELIGEGYVRDVESTSVGTIENAW